MDSIGTTKLEALRNLIIAKAKAGQIALPDGTKLSDVRTMPLHELNALMDGTEPVADPVPVAPVPVAPVAPVVSGGAASAADLLQQAMQAMLQSQSAPQVDAEQVKSIARRIAIEVAQDVAVDVTDARLAAFKADFTKPNVIEVHRPTFEPVNIGIQHAKFTTLLNAATALPSPNIFISGPVASGKTHAAKSLAVALGLEFYSHGAAIMPSDLVGFVDAGGAFHPTQFTKCFALGGVVILDELDSYSERATLVLNEALANGSAVFGGVRVERHEKCIIIGGANTWGSGATVAFTGRNKLDQAFLDRFAARLDWPYDPALEAHIVGADQLEWLTFVNACRTRANEKGIKAVISPRSSVAGAHLLRAKVVTDHKDAARLTFAAHLDAATQKTLLG